MPSSPSSYLLRQMATGAVRLATQHRMQRRALATTTVPPSTVPPSEIARLLHAHRHRLTRGVAQFSPDTVFERASGVYLYDALSGRRFLDFGSGIGVVSTGHCHPRVVRAAQEQAGRIVHSQMNMACHVPMLQLMEKLILLMPSPALDHFFFVNSGSEAVENAIKLARHATGRSNLIVFKGGFHGRTLGCLSLTTSDAAYREGFGPFLGSIFVSPYPYAQHLPWLKTPQEVSDYAIQQLEEILSQQSPASDTAALLIEPILGEGGYVIPPPDFLPRVQQICNRHGILLIADEVQCGFGRTGKMFAVEHCGVQPDMLVMAKGLASGFQLSAIAGRKEIMDTQHPGAFGGTYSGHAVSCAAAVATIDVIHDEQLLDNATARGTQMCEHLHRLHERFPRHIADVRGVGLMNALEFKQQVEGGDLKLTGIAKELTKACLRRGLVLLKCSTYETVRLIPPLVISAQQMDEGMEVIAAAVEEVIRHYDKSV